MMKTVLSHLRLGVKTESNGNLCVVGPASLENTLC